MVLFMKPLSVFHFVKLLITLLVATLLLQQKIAHLLWIHVLLVMYR